MNIQNTSLKAIKERAKLLEPIIRIGKKGITDNVVSDIKNHLKNRKVIKVKMLRSFFENKDKKLVAKEIAEKTDSILVDTIGFVFVLLKKS